jgi:hypothetical protein
LVSWKLDTPGTAGAQRGRTPRIVNGTMPMNASPSKVPIASSGGTSGRSATGGTRQCKNASWRQR